MSQTVSVQEPNSAQQDQRGAGIGVHHHAPAAEPGIGVNIAKIKSHSQLLDILIAAQY